LQLRWRGAARRIGAVMESNASVCGRDAEPLVSVIVVTRDRAEYLERALDSIFAAVEEYPNTEVMVIDGGSQDGTVALLKRHSPQLAYWISEPDSSVGEAVNKGLARARGEFVHLAADDDEFLPDTISGMVRYLVEHPEVDSVSGEAEYLTERLGGEMERMTWLPAANGRWSLEMLLRASGGSIWPEQQFSRRAVYVRFGGYDIAYKYFGYWELFCRQVKGGAVFEHIPRVVLRRIFTPKSEIFVQNARTARRERYRILWRHGGMKWVSRTMWQRNVVPAWYRILKMTQPMRHPVKAARGAG
jgi:glycosyltransferase involved in cell wall biosynthesis